MPPEAKKKTVITVLILFASMAIIGYTSVSQSGYKPLASILDNNGRSKVVVEAYTANLGEGSFSLIINGVSYHVEAHGHYGVAWDGEGNTYAIFLLRDGPVEALALYRVADDTVAYQAGSGLRTKVVVSGIFDPSIKAEVILPSGESLRTPVIFVDSILKGCHSSYEQGSGTIG